MQNKIVPTESEEGKVLVQWLRIHNITFSHIPNETGHSDEAKRRAIRMKQQGTSKGFPDYVIALPGIGMVYIELKRLRGSTTSPEQKAWIEAINECPGAEAMIAKGAGEAIAFVKLLISGEPQPTQDLFPF
jgi:hypothetical protein